jgi:hypothetical protein
MRYIKIKNIGYFLIDIRLDIEWVQSKDIHRTNTDINKIYKNCGICD